MPFKMMSPLSKVATSAMKKMKDLSGDGKVTKKDVLIGRGVLNKDGSPANLGVDMPNKMKSSGLKAMGGSTMKSEKSTPLFVNSPAKVAKKGDLIGQVVGDVSNIASSVSNMLKKAKDDFYKQREERLEKARTKEEKDKVLKDLPNSKLSETLEKIRKENEIEKPTSDKKSTTKGAGGKGGGSSTGTSKKLTYSQAWDKMTDAAKDKYKSKADFIKAAKAYNVKIGKTKATTGPTAKEVDNQAKTDVEMKQSDVDKKNAEDKKKFEASKAKAAEAAAEKKKKEKAAADLKAAEEYNKKNLKTRSRSREKVKVDVVKDKKTGARLKTKTRTRKDGTVKTKVKETRIIGGVASKTRKVKDTRKEQREKDKKKNGKGAGNKIVPKQNRQM